MPARFWLCLGAAFIAGCLPSESREEPGSLALSVRTHPSSLEPGGVVTDDGWTLHFERYFAGLGSAELQGDDCEPYSEDGYGRILDMTRAEAQPLSLTFGLGRCDLGLRLLGPRWNSVLGRGVDAEVAALLASAGSDTVRSDSSVSIYIEGGALRGTLAKGFAWAFRAQISYESCRSEDAEGGPRALELRSGERLALELVFDANALFRDSGELLFAPLAAADDAGDSDGIISLAELATTSPLFEQIYFTRLPALVQLPSGRCRHQVTPEEDEQ